MRKTTLDKCAEELLLLGNDMKILGNDNSSYHPHPSDRPDRKELIEKIRNRERKLLNAFRTGRYKKSVFKEIISYQQGNTLIPNAILLRITAGLAFIQLFEDVSGYVRAHLAKWVSLDGKYDQILYAKKLINHMISIGQLKEHDNFPSTYICNVYLPNRILDLFTGENIQQKTVRQKLEIKKKRKEDVQVADFLNATPIMTPKEMYEKVEEYGFIGQEQSRRALATLAYRHLKRIRQIHLEGIKESDLPPRENILCMGKTGVGKTLLATIMFSQILKLPCTIIDITNFTSVGYVGRNTPEILNDLIQKADGNVPMAEIGVIIIDEVDKIASAGTSSQLYGGEGTGKDIAGGGVQRQLLKMLETNWTTDVTIEGHTYRGKSVSFRTNNVLFLGLGAFSGFDACTEKNKSSLGFHCGDERRTNNRQIITANDFQRYGFCPEFYGRFSQVLKFNDLSTEHMRQILENSISKYRRELALDSIGLEIEDSVRELLIDDALEMGTGARALGCIPAVDNALFYIYSTPGTGRTLKLSVDKNSEIKSVIIQRAGTVLVNGSKETILHNGKETEIDLINYG